MTDIANAPLRNDECRQWETEKNSPLLFDEIISTRYHGKNSSMPRGKQARPVIGIEGWLFYKVN